LLPVARRAFFTRLDVLRAGFLPNSVLLEMFLPDHLPRLGDSLLVDSIAASSG
jgi:hypothetical protein